MYDLSPSILTTRLADIVRDDPRVAPVFDRFGLDYCCHGQQTLQMASIDRHVAISEVLDELEALGPRPDDGRQTVEWADLPSLIRHVVTQHHRYVREHQPVLEGWLDKLVSRHGTRHPELHEIRGVFEALSRDLLRHMAKEENILFPYIEQLSSDTDRGSQPVQCSPFGTILNPIRVMEQEHLAAGNLLARLRMLTSGYQPPEDGCTTYRVCFEGLARFEADLHQHVHLENHVLFPRALALENRGQTYV